MEYEDLYEEFVPLEIRGNVTDFAPYKALKSIARGKLPSDERFMLHRVARLESPLGANTGSFKNLELRGERPENRRCWFLRLWQQFFTAGEDRTPGCALSSAALKGKVRAPFPLPPPRARCRHPFTLLNREIDLQLVIPFMLGHIRFAVKHISPVGVIVA